MKKIHFILSLILLTTLNCINDDDNDSPITSTHLKLSTFSKNTNTYTISYTDDRPVSIVSSNNEIIDLDYSIDGKLIKFGDYNYVYDNTNTLTRIQSTDGISNFEYTDQGTLRKQIVITTSQTTITRDFSYNSENKLVKIRETDNLLGSNTITEITLIYDTDGVVEVVKDVSSNGGANFNTVSETLITYEATNNPLLLFTESMGFTSEVIPVFNNPLMPQTSLGIRLGSRNDFLLNYITKNPIRYMSKRDDDYYENFSYTSSNDYPVEALYSSGDDIGTIDFNEYSWSYTTQ